MSGNLPESGELFRAVLPGQYDTDSPHPTAFQDTGGPQGALADDLSFSAASPRRALEAISGRGAVKRLCDVRDPDTGRLVQPTAEQMYAAGFRVSATPTEFVHRLVAVAPDVCIKLTAEGQEVSATGHVGVVNGHKFSPQFAANSRIAGEDETLS